MTITNGYASLADYKTWISMRGLSGNVGIDTSDDSVLEILIESASRYIDRQVSSRFFQGSASEVRYYTAPAFTEVWIDPLTTLVKAMNGIEKR